jgi:hypothetical protein
MGSLRVGILEKRIGMWDTDMDEPVKSFLFGMAIISLVAHWSVGIPGVRRLSTVNHTDIRGLPPGLASGAGIGRWVEHA